MKKKNQSNKQKKHNKNTQHVKYIDLLRHYLNDTGMKYVSEQKYDGKKNEKMRKKKQKKKKKNEKKNKQNDEHLYDQPQTTEK